jgi:hypothetical protein
MTKQARPKSRPPSRPRRSQNRAGEFKCTHCHALVSTHTLRSGVNNRNHCPFCLWSKHVDLKAAGDRLADCQGAMPPIGLTVKKIHKKYGDSQGELMLIHRCTVCGKLSINRIAADDDPRQILQVFESSQALDRLERDRLEADGIAMLKTAQADSVRRQLFGKEPGG